MIITVEDLKYLMSNPVFVETIVGDYQGSYSVGIGNHPDNPSRLAIIVHVQGDDPSVIKREWIMVDMQFVPVVVETGFITPEAL